LDGRARGAAFDVDNVFRKPKLAHHRNGDRRKGFVDFDPFDIAGFPARALQRRRCR